MESQIASRVMDASKVVTFMQFVSDPEILKILTDKNHYPILKLLKTEVSTVRELEERYEETTGKKKSNKTIYRYLKTLEDAKLVQPVGQLVTPGKTATETIYGRTAHAFYMKPQDEKNYYESEIGQRVLKHLALLLKPVFNYKNVDLPKFTRVMHEHMVKGEEKLEEIAEEMGDQMAEELRGTNLDEINHILKLASTISAIKSNPNFNTKLDECYS